ncbi:unnamed protein product (macronuclear) [Paramecium tetraurelia]|uniref:PAS domain-containing protein n=1 Tax=Paramecium tetraurelia TaxID=5888 RepID=A0BRT0_PARTE|nr:uncharacterized protein GSPATT00031478001 [Paramecium tetraurelia]CAK61247.1 unnamed protein product [Paramecium tetraurelia]|eukprot:XP_001428645.1 hypothetical protein (macronuclear) [Paramecium tetraurelia strain d4-2]
MSKKNKTIVQTLKFVKFLNDHFQNNLSNQNTQSSNEIQEMLLNDHISMPFQVQTETNIMINNIESRIHSKTHTQKNHFSLRFYDNQEQISTQRDLTKYIINLIVFPSLDSESQQLEKKRCSFTQYKDPPIQVIYYQFEVMVLDKQLQLQFNIINQEEFKQSKIQGVTKTICKLKQSTHQNVQISKKIILPILSISRPISTVIKSSVELKLALQCPQERCLGSLCENPCTYNYKVCRVDQKHDLFIFSLQQYDRHQYTKQQICQIIKNMNDQYSQQALECVEQRFKILDNFQQQTLISDNELIEFEQSLHKYPFQCTLQNVNTNNSTLSFRIINQKFLDLMGITKDMMFDHLNETQALPTIFNHDGSLKNWCELAQYSVEGREFFDYYLNTYEGSQFRSKVQQKQIFKSSPLDPNQIIFIEFRIIHADPKLLSNLCNSTRILKNHADYFNLKNSDIILNQFKQSTKYLDAKNYKITKPCGYKIIDQNIKP